MIFRKWKFWVYAVSVSVFAGLLPVGLLPLFFGVAAGWIAYDNKHWFD